MTLRIAFLSHSLPTFTNRRWSNHLDTLARAPGGVDTVVKGFPGTGTKSELHHTGITRDKNDNRNNYTEITWPLTTHLNEQDNGEGCEEINILSAYKLRINKINSLNRVDDDDVDDQI